MKPVSDKRAEWLRAYRELRDSITPDQCARCSIKGSGWEHKGGDFQCHHPYRRTTRWRMLCFIPLCPRCHEEIEGAATQARADGWIIDPNTVSMFR